MKIQTGYNEKRSIPQPCVYYFEMNIRQTTLNDNGTYVMKSSFGETRCQILRVNVIVREPQPVCTTHLENERGNLRLSCEWLPWKSDNMELVVGDQPLPKDSTQKRMNGEKTVISATFPLQDAFDVNHVPDACVVSNSDLGFQNQCIFSVYMLPSMNEVTKNGGQATFACCTNTVNPRLGFYNEFLKFIPYTAGQSLMLDLVSYRHVLGDNASVFLICGEDDHDGINSFRMGKIIFGSRFNTNISLKADIKIIVGAAVDSNPGFQSCAHAYNISVIANYVEHEFATEHTTPGIIGTFRPSSKTFNPTNSQIFNDNYGVIKISRHFLQTRGKTECHLSLPKMPH